jgi:serine/threonine-protein kinase HipA
MPLHNKCLYCYEELQDHERDFHAACSRKMFGSSEPPELPYTEADMFRLGVEVVKNHIAVPGVQTKVSLELEAIETKNNIDKALPGKLKRFTIVGLWGGYILKPPAKAYPHMPEVEDVTMHLASLAGLDVVPHALIRLQSGNLAYITRRIDREKKNKIHMEDMCQLTERLTEDKYKGSYEQIGKTILKYSVNPGLDLVNFFEQLIFSFITGNADMHLKNFSLINRPGMGYVLSPGYDMLATALVNRADKEELALHLNGKKNRIRRADFESAFDLFNLDSKVRERMVAKFNDVLPVWFEFLEQSFLSDEMKLEYISLIKSRISRLNR